MTGEKMFRVLSALQAHGQALRGVCIDCTGGSELRIEPNGQLDAQAHAYMLRKGFVYVDSAYVYRPPT